MICCSLLTVVKLLLTCVPAEVSLGMDIRMRLVPSAGEAGGREAEEEVLVYWRPGDMVQACQELIRSLFNEGKSMQEKSNQA